MSGSDSDVAATIKADALTDAGSGLGRVMSLTTAAMMALMVTDDINWLLHGTEEKKGVNGGGQHRTSSGGGAYRRQGGRLRWRSMETCAREK
jgi:hypothetical protein